jgi:proteic killer suppression protein
MGRVVILSFRNRALQRFWQGSDRKGLNPQHISKIDRILRSLGGTNSVEDMAVPGFRLHKLAGYSPERWSVWVNANWRITFSFVDGDAFDVDYEDYH